MFGRSIDLVERKIRGERFMGRSGGHIVLIRVIWVFQPYQSDPTFWPPREI